VAIPEAVTVLDVVACPSTPVAHLAIVFAPCVDGPIADGDLGSTASLTIEIGGRVHVAIDTATNMGYGVSSSKAVRALVHRQAFSLE